MQREGNFIRALPRDSSDGAMILHARPRRAWAYTTVARRAGVTSWLVLHSSEVRGCVGSVPADSMEMPMAHSLRWTVADLDILAVDEDTHYEIIDGELHVHQPN